MLSLLLLVAIADADTTRGGAAAAPRPVEQRLELELDPGARAWSGSLLATLEVAGAGRRFRLRLAGPVVSRVEMTDGRGRVDLSWGREAGGLLLVETARALVPGRASLNVAFDGEWAAAAPGVCRDSARARAWLERGEGLAFPAWPGSAAATRWTLLVHAPRAFEVRATGSRAGIDATRGWRTWTFRTARALVGDSLRVTVRRPAGRGSPGARR